MTVNTLNSVNLLRSVHKSSCVTNTVCPLYSILYSIFLLFACHPLLASPEHQNQLQAFYPECASSFSPKQLVTRPSSTPALGPSGPKALGTRLPPVAHSYIARSRLETNIAH